MKLSTTILSIPLTMTIASIVFSVFALMGATTSIDNLRMSSDMSNETNLINEIRYNISMMRGSINTLDADVSAFRQPSKNYIEDYNRRKNIVLDSITILNKREKNNEVNEIITKTIDLVDIYDYSMSQILGNKNATTSTSTKLKELTDLVRRQIENKKMEMAMFLDKGNNNSILIKLLSVCFVVLSVLLLIFSIFIAKIKITKKINALTFAIEKVSQGNLSENAYSDTNNEIDEIFVHVNNMRQSLVKMISSIKRSTSIIHNGSSEISAGNDDLSSRTEEQASALQETAASIEQIKTTVTSNTENARQANVIAAGASQTADDGSVVMENAIASMKKVKDSASRITEITDVINGIASQTNILALNAAVEAARAGKQGAGFMVVASEVRNLATRSTEAAKEISDIIRVSVNDITLGTDLVNGAGESMQNIVKSVTQVSNLMQDITVASEEQKSGIDSIAVAINQMDLVTQQNATLVEQAAVATTSLYEQAQQLTEIVDFFHVGEEKMKPSAVIGT